MFLIQLGAPFFVIGVVLMIVGHTKSRGKKTDMFSKIGYWLLAIGCVILIVGYLRGF